MTPEPLPRGLRTLIILASAAFLWALVLFPLWVMVR